MAETSVTTLTCQMVPWGTPLDARLCDAWDALAARDTLAPPFSQRAWFDIAIRCGCIKPGWMLLMRVGDHPVALFPLVKRGPGNWAVVSYGGMAELQILVDPDWEAHVWPALARWVATSPGVTLFTLGETEDRERIDRLTAAAEAHRLQLALTPCPATVWSHLPHSWELFLKQIGSVSAKDIRRAERKMAEEYPDAVVEYLSTPRECLEALPHFFHFFRRHWGRQPLGCIFDRPNERAFYTEVVAWGAEHGYVVISRLTVQGQPIAFQVMFRVPGGNALYQQYCSRDLAALPKHISPGIVEFAHTFRWAMANGITEINQGLRMVEYKRRFGGVEHPRWEVTLARSRAALAILPQLTRMVYVARRADVHLHCRTRHAWRQLRQYGRPVEPYDRIK